MATHPQQGISSIIEKDVPTSTHRPIQHKDDRGVTVSVTCQYLVDGRYCQLIKDRDWQRTGKLGTLLDVIHVVGKTVGEKYICQYLVDKANNDRLGK